MSFSDQGQSEFVPLYSLKYPPPNCARGRELAGLGQRLQGSVVALLAVRNGPEQIYLLLKPNSLPHLVTSSIPAQYGFRRSRKPAIKDRLLILLVMQGTEAEM
jgi:hypothetical protein